MRCLYNFLFAKYFVVFLLLINVTSYVNAQFALLRAGKDNFTSFTTQKTYPDIAKINETTPENYRNNPDFGKCYTDSLQWYEQIDKRTLKSRSYVAEDNKVIIEYGYNNLNYVDEKGWMRAVDTKLKPCAEGWSAQQQEIPVYLYTDASTSLSIGHNEEIIFNKNVQFNQQAISTGDYTVGDNGMYIRNAVSGTDKIIRFGRGRVESDYHINQPLKLNGDLVISEDVILPEGYTITSGDKRGSLIVNGPDGKIAAELKAPLCYDNRKNSVIGTYHLQKQLEGYRLEVDVPSAWINDAARQYPITIDPTLTGPTSVWSGGIINSCYDALSNQPANATDTGSISVAIPADITITAFYAGACFYSPFINSNHGTFWFWASCGDSLSTTYSGPDTSAPGYVYIILDSANFLQYVPDMLCCFQPSCNIQTFNFTMALVRNEGGAGCDTGILYYDPNNDDGFPFEAFVVGNTVAGSYLTADSICGNDCSFNLIANAEYGVPPYKVAHPWANNPITFGGYSTQRCTSSGTTNVVLNIPNCPGTSSTLTISAPAVTDACGNTVGGLLSRTISVENLLSVSRDTTIYSGKSVQLLAQSNGSVTWSPATGLNTTSGDSIIATPTITTTYKAVAIHGACKDSANVTIIVKQPCNEIKVPSAFTPNGDVNDHLHILDYAQVQLLSFRVFNRWGQMVYEANNLNDPGWDGTFNGKPQPMGTYVYFLQANCQGETVSLKGDVTLLR